MEKIRLERGSLDEYAEERKENREEITFMLKMLAKKKSTSFITLKLFAL